MSYVLFPLGVRTSTWITVAAFAITALRSRNEWRVVLLAGWAWLAGFEAAFQIASIALHKLPLGLAGPIFFIVLGLVSTTYAYWRGIRVEWWLLAVAVALMLTWVLTGFHLSGHQHGMFSLHENVPNLDPTAELLNELSKSLWALAYLVPLWLRPGRALRAGGQAAL